MTAKVKYFTEEEYYQDREYLNFSGLKLFSKCETLYRDTFITKSYTEPDKEYYLYGKIVDCYLTEPHLFEEKFIRVERRINVEDALQYENEIKELALEIKELEPKVEKGNKTAIKGKESRQKKILEITGKLKVIKDLADKVQVTNSTWKDAMETAEALKAHPFYQTMKFDEYTSQQTVACVVKNVPRKGRLDYFSFSPKVRELYIMWRTNLVTLEEMQEKIKALDPKEVWCQIVDLKTCYDLKKLEPYNYRGQLKFYQDIVFELTGIKADCYILAGDKTGEFKKAELFYFPQPVLDDIGKDIDQWAFLWQQAVAKNLFVSSKEKLGIKQECYTCSECRNSPFSMKPGTPVVVDKPRFGSPEEIISNIVKDETQKQDY